MKRYLSVLIIGFMAVRLWAADLPKQGFGFHIGYAQPALRLNSLSNPVSAKDSLSTNIQLLGFKAGVVYDGSIIKGFGTSIGINYTFGKYNSGWRAAGIIGDYPRSRQIVYYHEVELFADWQYKFEVAQETYLILYTGPTIQCGAGMKMRSDHQNDFDSEITYSYYDGYSSENENKNEQFKRFNVTWGVGAGFQYKRYFLRGGYDFGLINPYANNQFVDAAGNQLDRYTHGRLDQWQVKIGVYLWYED